MNIYKVKVTSIYDSNINLEYNTYDDNIFHNYTRSTKDTVVLFKTIEGASVSLPIEGLIIRHILDNDYEI